MVDLLDIILRKKKLPPGPPAYAISQTQRLYTGPLEERIDPDAILRADLFPLVPPNDNLVATGVTKTWTTQGKFEVTELAWDVPANVDFDIFLDGNLYVRINDGLGSSAALQTGDVAAGIRRTVQNFKVVATNNGAASANVRAYATVIS